MTDPNTIPANFRVPKGCHHQWILFHDTHIIGGICGVPGRNQIHQAFRDSPAPEADHALLRSRTLDWIQESIEHLRWICEQ